MNALPTIVIAAFDRHLSLKRLLSSLASSHIPIGTPLLISIDKNNNNEVYKLADEFQWKWGKKEVVVHKEHLGLKKHILYCGDLTYQCNDIILLEDDLFLSPYFYQYSQEAINFYKNDARVAGISLYSANYSETAEMHFTPLKSGADIYFMQIPSSWGQCWSQEQWNSFKKWFSANEVHSHFNDKLLPPNVYLWGETSWKKFFFKYIIDTNKYFVYPYDSLSTNFADTGTNHKDNWTFLQVPLLISPKKFQLLSLDECQIIYDSFGELLPEKLKQQVPDLSSNFKDLSIDLYGKKQVQHLTTEYVITSKKCENPIIGFARQLKPHELNITMGIKESPYFYLAKTTDCDFSKSMRSPRPPLTINELSYYYNIPELKITRDLKMIEI